MALNRPSPSTSTSGFLTRSFALGGKLCGPNEPLFAFGCFGFGGAASVAINSAMSQTLRRRRQKRKPPLAPPPRDPVNSPPLRVSPPAGSDCGHSGGPHQNGNHSSHNLQ